MNVAVDSEAKRFAWTPDFWQGWRESQSPYRRHKSERDREIVLALLEPRDGERILEVGCGYGWISVALWQAARIHWFGVDGSPAMIQQLRRLPPPGGELPGPSSPMRAACPSAPQSLTKSSVPGS